MMARLIARSTIARFTALFATAFFTARLAAALLTASHAILVSFLSVAERPGRNAHQSFCDYNDTGSLESSTQSL